MATSVELRNQRATTWERFKEIVDGAEAESRAPNAEEKENVSKVNEELDSLDERIANQERLEQTRAAPESRNGSGPIAASPDDGRQPDTGEERTEKLNAAFLTYLRRGMSGLNDEQRTLLATRQSTDVDSRALAVGVDTAGGFLVPDDFQKRIESAKLWYGGMRESGATILPTESGNPMPMPTDNDTGNTGELVGENQAVTEQDVTVGQRVLNAYFYSSREVRVPYSLLQDAAFPIESWLADKLAERIGRITNLHFTTGSGADRPTGITIDSVLGVTAAATGAVTTDELIDLEHAVDRAYRDFTRCRWMCHDLTLRELRQLKDGEGRYLWQPGIQVGNPNTLFGYQYVVNNDMPRMTTGLRAILFGDFSKYYIRDVVGFTLLTLRERHAENLQVAFIGFSRHDGKLVDAGGSPVQHILMA